MTSVTSLASTATETSLACTRNYGDVDNTTSARRSAIIMGPSRLVVFLCLLIAIIPFARGQNQCSRFEEGLLGSTGTASSMGLIRDAIAASVGEGTTITVQVHASNIVCLRSGRTRDTYIHWCFSSRELHLQWCFRVYWEPHTLPVRLWVCYWLHMGGQC